MPYLKEIVLPWLLLFLRTKITYSAHNLVTGDGSLLLYWEAITHIYIYKYE